MLLSAVGTNGLGAERQLKEVIKVHLTIIGTCSHLLPMPFIHWPDWMRNWFFVWLGASELKTKEKWLVCLVAFLISPCYNFGIVWFLVFMYSEDFLRKYFVLIKLTFRKCLLTITPVAVKSPAVSILLLTLRGCEPVSAKTVTWHTWDWTWLTGIC